MLASLVVLFLIFILLVVTIIFLYDTVFVAKTPFISLDKDTIREILITLKISPETNFVELGCGDGRVLEEVSKLQPQATIVGVEKALRPYMIAKIKTRDINNANTYLKDLRNYNFENADIVFVYLMPELIKSIKPKLHKTLERGGTVVAVEFKIPSTKPSKIIKLKHRSQFATKWYLYN